MPALQEKPVPQRNRLFLAPVPCGNRCSYLRRPAPAGDLLVLDAGLGFGVVGGARAQYCALAIPSIATMLHPDIGEGWGLVPWFRGGTTAKRARVGGSCTGTLREPVLAEAVLPDAQFVAWWDANVGVRHGLNRHTVEISVRKSLTADDAEAHRTARNGVIADWRVSIGTGRDKGTARLWQSRA